MPIYSERRDRLKDGGFDLYLFAQVVSGWLEGRPPIAHTDANLTKVRDHTVNEVREARIERDKIGRPDYSVASEAQELGDCAWLPIAFMVANQKPIDFYQVRKYINGVGPTSGIYDALDEAAGNISEKDSDKDIEHFLGLVISALAGLPEYMQPEQIIDVIARKNYGNYPSEAFVGIHPDIHRPLNPDQLQLAFKHARRCLRFIRDFHVNELGHKDRSLNGLKREDFMPYLPLILAYLNIDLNKAQYEADQAYARLQLEIHEEYGMLDKAGVNLR